MFRRGKRAMNVAHLLTEAAKDRPLTTILVRALEAYISQGAS